MKRTRNGRILALIYMPILFSVIGYGLIAYAMGPVWEMTAAAANLLIGEDTPVFTPELTNIFDPEAIKEKARPYISIDEIEMPSFGTQYAEVSCERIEMEAPVYWGDSGVILRAGIGQYATSFPPGFGRCVVLVGHSTTYCKPLENVEIGDVFTLRTNYCDYEYTVTDLEVYTIPELSNKIFEYLAEDEEKLVMYTCYPFGTNVGRKVKRFTVIAERSEGYDVKWKASQYD